MRASCPPTHPPFPVFVGAAPPCRPCDQCLIRVRQLNLRPRCPVFAFTARTPLPRAGTEARPYEDRERVLCWRSRVEHRDQGRHGGTAPTKTGNGC
jgi:hypothetical protein